MDNLKKLSVTGENTVGNSKKILKKKIEMARLWKEADVA
jgi:hypothetical protein